jgi:protein-disulfide isomerase
VYAFLLVLLAACAGPSAPAASTPATTPVTTPVVSRLVAPAVAAAPAPLPTIEPGTTVATWRGGTSAYADVTGAVRNELVRLESEYLTSRYDTERAALDERINLALLEAEAKGRGMSGVDALLAAEVEAKTPRPTEAEVQELYAANARRLGGRPLDDVRPDVEQAVLREKQSVRFGAYIDALRAQYDVQVSLPFPNLPSIDVKPSSDDPFQGAADAPVVIVQYAEFQCPYCGSAREALDQVLTAYPGKVRVEFRDFPLDFHDRAVPAAVAANCAAKQDKYWPMHDALMKNQRALQEADLERVAADIALDLAKWRKCRQDVSMEAEVRADQAEGASYGVTGTPAFFINGIMVSGALPFERFKLIIDSELARKGA